MAPITSGFLLVTMLICDRCNQPRRQVGPLLLPHACALTIVTKAAPVFNDPVARIDLLGVGIDWSPTVYAEYYVTSPLIYAAVKLRAEAICRPPLKVWLRAADGTEEEAPHGHALQVVLDKANEWWTTSDLLRATSTYFDLFGSAFWVLEKSGSRGEPIRIWAARPDRMRIVPQRDGYIAGFVYGGIGATAGGGKRYRPDEVVWFRNFNPLDEFAGLSPVAPGRLSIDMAADATKHNRAVFQNGLLGDSVITSKGHVTQEQVDDVWARLKKKFATPDNSHRPMILDSEMDAKLLTLSARDMEFNASLRWSLEDVCRIYGVPKTLLHDLERATYSNVDAEERIFWRNAIVPQLCFFEGKINEMLAPQFGDDVFVRFDLSEIEALAENEVEIADTEREDVKAGIITINEVRERRGLEPVPWGDEPPAPAMPFGGFGQEAQNGNPRGGELPPPARGWTNGKRALSTGRNHDLRLEVGGYRRWVLPEQTEAWLDNHWQEFSKRFDRQTDRFSKIQRDLFRRQLFAVIRRLRDTGMVLGISLFNPADWIEQFLEHGREPMVAALASNAQAQIDAYRLGISFDLKRPVVQEWIDRRLNLWAGLTNEETARLLNQEVVAALDNGESIREMQVRVEKIFNFNDAVRSERIARTESLSASNRGALEAYRQSGVVESKTWLATRDDRTRDAHADANGQTVPLDVPFLVMGESVMAPGEGSAANSVSCRCTIIPVLEQQRALPETNGHHPLVIVKTVERDTDGFPTKVTEEHRHG